MVPALTFTIPCRNGVRHLRPLLESLLGQEGVETRVILVDDASTDGSVALAREVGGSRVTVVENQRALGIPGNWNRCAELVRTEFFCIAHQDDVYAPHFARVLLTALTQNPRAAAAHCRARAIDAEGRPAPSLSERYKERFWRRLPPVEDAARGFRRLYAGNYVCCPSLVYRTAAFRAVGAFDTHFRFAPDWEWLLRCCAKGLELAAVGRTLLSYRRHEAQATRHHARSLQRYREEHAVLSHARLFGVGAGLLPAGARSTAMRDNLLYDAFRDLLDRDVEAARDKLELLADLDPGARRSTPARALSAAARLGWPGRTALRLAVRGFVAWSAR
ncbi:MAG TPA: glycosyltransferase [Planctomycetota bacterium]|nr:glycosyltransferase [Planctomycetota bacterium]